MGNLSNISPYKGDGVTPLLQKWLDILWKALNGDIEVGGVIIGGVAVNLPITSSPVATTSGTSVSISATIPSWARKITLSFSSVSTNNTSNIIVQVGPSGGLATSGYTGSATYTLDASAISGQANSNGFRITNGWAAAAQLKGHAFLTLQNSSTNTWEFSSLCARDNMSTWQSAGEVSLSGALTQIAITTAGGVDTFDNGSVTLRYEY